jgi:hypothetical protein
MNSRVTLSESERNLERNAGTLVHRISSQRDGCSSNRFGYAGEFRRAVSHDHRADGNPPVPVDQRRQGRQGRQYRILLGSTFRAHTGSSWGLPFELVLEVAAFCAGSLEFKAYLNISLASKEVHKSLKPDKSLKPVLDEPVVVWNDKTPLSDDFYEACAEGDLAQYMREHSKELPKQAKFWSKVRWVVSRHSGSVSC